MELVDSLAEALASDQTLQEIETRLSSFVANIGFTEFAYLWIGVPILEQRSLVLSNYPPVWTMSRTVMADDQIGTYQVSRGETIMLCPWAVHRHAGHWENPEGFDPSRFLEGAPLRHPFAWFPFGRGPRSCQGEKFAEMEALIVMAMVMQNWRLDLVPGAQVEPQPMITLRPNRLNVRRCRL